MGRPKSRWPGAVKMTLPSMSQDTVLAGIWAEGSVAYLTW
jgi:hypothetical protein